MARKKTRRAVKVVARKRRTITEPLAGLPLYVASMVLSVNHVNSLKVQSEIHAPGQKPEVIGTM